jgi:5,10-methylenetetrahydromethanopterin reductase
MMPSDFSVALDGLERPDAVRAIAQAAEAGGARTLWLATHLFNREPIASAAVVLAATSKLKIALMAMSPYTVHPIYAAMAAATLDEWFPGRVELCLGVGAPRDLEAAGVVATRPVRTMAESLVIARALLAGETVTHDGESFRVQGRRLATGARAVPLILAASGPQMLALAGRAADGVLISAATSPAFITWTLAQAAVGAAGRERPVRRIALVCAAVDDVAEHAHARLRRRLGFVLRGPHHAMNLRLAGSSLDQTALAEAYAREDWAQVQTLVSDDVVRRHAASGTPADVRHMFDAYSAIGLDEIVLSGFRDGNDVAAILSAARGE